MIAGTELMPEWTTVYYVFHHVVSRSLARWAARLLPLFIGFGATLQRSRRTNLDIVADLLRLTSTGGATKTALVYKANLNFKLVQRYIDHLESRGMIMRVEGEFGTLYSATKKGQDALKSINSTLGYFSDAKARDDHAGTWP